MKVKLRITKDGTSLYEGIYDVADAESFGRACSGARCGLEQQQVEKESSIGALLEHLKDDTAYLLVGANITLEQV